MEGSRLAVPLAATGWMLLQAQSWHQKPGWIPALVLALAGWGFALLATAATGDRLHRMRAGGAVAALTAGLALGLWKLPSQLVFPTGTIIAMIAAVQALWMLGKNHRAVGRFALLLTGLAGLAIIALAPLDVSPLLRLGVIAAYGFAIVQGFSDTGRQALPGLSSVRAVTFTTAVLAPTSWYVEGGLPAELLRRENLCLLLLSALACAAVHRQPTAGKFGKTALLLALGSFILAGYAAAAAFVGHPGAAGPTLSAVALGGTVLAIGLVSRQPALREAAMLAPWALLPFVSRWVSE